MRELPFRKWTPAHAATTAPQVKAGLRMFSESWGKLEAALARDLHDSSANAIRSMHWDQAHHAVTYRHMPEVPDHPPSLSPLPPPPHPTTNTHPQPSSLPAPRRSLLGIHLEAARFAQKRGAGGLLYMLRPVKRGKTLL